MLYTLLRIVDGFLTLYGILLLIRALLSWFPNVDRDNAIVRFIYQITDPILEPIRRIMPPTGMFDFSVMVAALLIFVLQQVLHSIMFR